MQYDQNRPENIFTNFIRTKDADLFRVLSVYNVNIFKAVASILFSLRNVKRISDVQGTSFLSKRFKTESTIIFLLRVILVLRGSLVSTFYISCRFFFLLHLSDSLLDIGSRFVYAYSDCTIYSYHFLWLSHNTVVDNNHEDDNL